MSIEPRSHQQRALKAIDAWRATEATRAKVLMACGLGKTLVSAWGAAWAAKAVFLAPSIQVTGQAAKEWDSVGRRPDLLVCSDDDAMFAKEDPDRFEIATTTTVEEICTAIAGRDSWTLFGTYASAARIGQALLTLGVEADLLICDEAHHVAGPEGKARSNVLHDEHLPARRRLFYTATPRENTRSYAKAIGMEDETLFGPTISRTSVRAGIEMTPRRLAPYRVHRPVAERVDSEDPDQTRAACLSAVVKFYKSGAINCGIAFCRTIETCKTVAATLVAEGIPSEWVSGELPISERKERIRRVLASGGIIVSDQALAEGVDLPAVDAVIFVDRRASPIYIMQAIGRALRIDKARPDKVAAIVIPMMKGDDNTEVNGTFAEVLNVLYSEDEMVKASINAIVAAEASGLPLDPKVRAQLDELGLLSLMQGPARDAILREVIGPQDQRFVESLALLRAFEQREGHARPPVDSVEGRFVAYCRSARGRRPDRDAELEALKEWAWNDHEASWFDNAAKFRKDPKKMAPWGAYANKCLLAGTLSANRAAVLEGLVLVNKDRPDVWRTNYDKYFAHVRERGEHPANCTLAHWGSDNRAAHRRGELSAERIALMEAIPGWAWTVVSARQTRARADAYLRKSAKSEGAILAQLGTDWRQISADRREPALRRLVASGTIERSPQHRPAMYRLSPAYLAEHNEPTEQAAK